ncbi:hypothetical protein F3Y22_tig00111952pilonHSYRG00051 [Hibiscus syriacus]|uniref:Uncharacterized protein n=1 Tax=Hibiscus syriacus TaxID=106335 RepID=A0A6A2XNK9_HIBSY|nr:hypothetical protein F3Y22_tig00111952pilonHSYRG00051 [Hibiscus syriacus]
MATLRGLGVTQTTPDFSPALGINHVVQKLTGVPVEPVLPEALSGHAVAGVGPGDYENEDEQHEEEENEDGHAEEVEGQKGFFVTVGADKADEGEDEDKEAEDDDGPPEEVDAAVVELLG